MRIQHNIAALNSYRNLTGNNNAVSKNLEKLSSGYRINRAGDDAAGLAISEKMRAQITGLNTAQKNAQDGVSLVQTAEGALTEVHSMLNRMVELADQSANGTYDNEVDRANLQKEIKSLKAEVDRIADSTNFNGINLLDGSLATTKLDITAATVGAGQGTITQVAATGAESVIKAVDGTDTNEQTLTVEYLDADGKSHKVDIKYKNDQGKNNVATNIANAIKGNAELSAIFDVSTPVDENVKLTSKVTGEKGAKLVSVSSTDTAKSPSVDQGSFKGGVDATVTLDAVNTLQKGNSITINGKTYKFVDNASDPVGEGEIAVQIGKTVGTDTIANLNKALEGTGIEVALGAGNKAVFSATKNGAGLTLQIGDTSADFNQMTVSVGDMHAEALGIADIDISTQVGAKAAVDKIKSAINSVSSTRGDLGAIQNRLEHTINNLSVTAENMTAAESRIRDVDMANEMMAYTKNNILVQSSQAMLAQANQLPQGVLQLLQ
jgi:flagellin